MLRGGSLWDVVDRNQTTETTTPRSKTRGGFAAALLGKGFSSPWAGDHLDEESVRRDLRRSSGFGVTPSRSGGEKRRHYHHYDTPSPFGRRGSYTLGRSPSPGSLSLSPYSPYLGYSPTLSRKFPRLLDTPVGFRRSVSRSPGSYPPSPLLMAGPRHGDVELDQGMAKFRDELKRELKEELGPEIRAEMAEEIRQEVLPTYNAMLGEGIRAARRAIGASSSEHAHGSGRLSHLERERALRDKVEGYRGRRLLLSQDDLRLDVKSLASYRKLLETVGSIDETPFGRTPPPLRHREDGREAASPTSLAKPGAAARETKVVVVRDSPEAFAGTAGTTPTSNGGQGDFSRECDRNIQVIMSRRSLRDAEEEAGRMEQITELQARLDSLDILWRSKDSGEIDAMLAREVPPTSVCKKELSAEHETMYLSIMGSDEDDDYALSRHKNLRFTVQDAMSLGPGEWLTDENINFFMSLLNDRARRRIEQKDGPACYFTNTFFLNKLYKGTRKYEYSGVRTWTRPKKIGVEITKCDKVVVPVHQQVHWCCAVADIKRKELVYYDSMLGKDQAVLENLARWVKDEWKDKAKVDLDTSKWPRKFPKDIPTQENGYDCGVFAVKFAECAGLDCEMDFSQQDMPLFRKQMVVQLKEVDLDAVDR